MSLPIESFDHWFTTHPPKLAFKGSTQDDFESWHQQLYTRLYEMSGLTRMEDWQCEPQVESVLQEDRDDHTMELLNITTAPNYTMPVAVLRPKGNGPFVPMVALHGHGRGYVDVLGDYDDKTGEKKVAQHNYAYATEAVKQSYIVFAPDKRGFGTRAGDGSQCVDLTTAAIAMGISLIGIHTWDNMRMIDYLQTRDDVKPGPVGCIGLSGGGGGTLWLAAMDDRIGAAVISGHLANYANGLFAHICNVVPNVLEWADRSDIAGLIAPRPLFIESASEDECFSRERAVSAYEKLCNIYVAADARNKLDIEYFEGRHEWSGRMAWPWLKRWLITD